MGNKKDITVSKRMIKGKTFIYALISPINFEVRYVGKSDDPWNRLYIGNSIHIAHLNDESRTHKGYWIRSLKRKNIIPILQILEVCKKYEWQKREIDWISFYRKIGCNLTNGTNGGDGISGHVFSEESRKRLSIALKNRKYDKKAAGRKISKALTGKKASEQTRQILSNAAKLRWITDVGFREKMSKIHKNKIWTEEERKKLSDIKKGKPPNNKGKKLSEETKKKMSESRKGWSGKWNKGRKTSEETKKKMSESRKGRPSWNKGIKYSEETKKKQSESLKLWWKKRKGLLL